MTSLYSASVHFVYMPGCNSFRPRKNIVCCQEKILFVSCNGLEKNRVGRSV